MFSFKGQCSYFLVAHSTYYRAVDRFQGFFSSLFFFQKITLSHSKILLYQTFSQQNTSEESKDYFCKDFPSTWMNMPLKPNAQTLSCAPISCIGNWVSGNFYSVREAKSTATPTQHIFENLSLIVIRLKKEILPTMTSLKELSSVLKFMWHLGWSQNFSISDVS